MRRYRSEACEAIHEETLLQYEAGLISEAEMREYDELCLVQEPGGSYNAELSVELEHRQSPLALSIGN
jgi:DNA-binding transcriptional regulator YiaG